MRRNGQPDGQAAPPILFERSGNFNRPPRAAIEVHLDSFVAISEVHDDRLHGAGRPGRRR